MTRTTLATLSLSLLLGPCLAQASPWPTVASAEQRRDQRIRLFRFQPGFFADPLGLFPEPPPDPSSLAEDLTPPGDSLDWVACTMGNDNPFTDFRPAGTQGGVGYYRVASQVRLLDTGATGCAFNLQAVTPAGREVDGVEYGPTVFTPALAVYHEVAAGVALHGFVGTSLAVNGLPSQATSNFAPVGLGPTAGSRFEYGVAVQHPLLVPEKEGGLYVYVGALGRSSDGRQMPTFREATLEVLPGLHWQVDRKTWLSGAVVLPVARPVRQEVPLWQVTCQFQF